MKKLLLILSSLLISQLIFGQTLDLRYSNLSATYYKFSPTEDGFAYFDKNANAVLVYNANSVLIKTINCPFTDPNASLYLISKVIINDNGKFKIVISHNKSISIYDEDQNQLFNRDSAFAAKFYNTTAGPKMILLSSSGGWQEVYSISGTLLKVKENILNNNQNLAFPNPTNGNLNIKLETNQNIKDPFILITDINGNLVDKKKISINNNETTIDVNNLNSGIYFYQINSSNFNSIPSKFIIEK